MRIKYVLVLLCTLNCFTLIATISGESDFTQLMLELCDTDPHVVDQAIHDLQNAPLLNEESKNPLKLLYYELCQQCRRRAK